MAVEISIHWEGRSAKDFARSFKIAANIDDFRPVFDKIASRVIAPSLAAHFEAGGNIPKWKALADATVRRKAAAGVSNPTKILVHTGALRKEATSEKLRQLTKGEMKLIPSLSYYAFHQKGTKRLPQRVIMRLTGQDRTDINSAFADFLRTFVNFNPATGGRTFTGGGLS